MSVGFRNRQDRRERSGRYSRYHPGGGLCELCLKPVEEDERWEMATPHLECLHKKCLDRLNKMSEEEAKHVTDEAKKGWYLKKRMVGNVECS